MEAPRSRSLTERRGDAIHIDPEVRSWPIDVTLPRMERRQALAIEGNYYV